MPRDPASQLTLAAISFPLMALVATFAIESVDTDEGYWYRIITGGLGICTVATGAIGSFQAFTGYYYEIFIPEAMGFTAASFGIAFILTILVIINEVREGVENHRTDLAIVVSLSVFVIALWLIT